MMERCNKAGEGFECVRLLGHAGDCECVSAGMFNTVMEDAENTFLYGNKAECMVIDYIGTHVDAHGRKYCAHPLKAFEWMMWCDGVWRACGGLVGVTLFPIMQGRATVPAPDHADELGKVWDVLHANGINGAEGLSASEGVQQLVVEHRLALDELLYGNSFATVDERGLKTRIDPRAMVINMPSRIKP